MASHDPGPGPAHGSAPGSAHDVAAVEVAGRRLTLRNLDKVLFPAAGFTKAEVLAYYTAVAPVLLPHLADRPLTRRRWPDGVAGESFFEKNAPAGTPPWVRTVRLPVPGSTKDRATIDFPVVEDLAALVWVAHLAALELHVPQWRVDAGGTALPPDRLVIDLDPGAPAGLTECARVALAVRDRLAADGLTAYPVTSGRHGLQLYAALPGDRPADAVSAQVKTLAQDLERELPRLVVSRMAKELRRGRVLLDWSQNNAAKTTICPYSLRGADLPTVAAPRHWAELEEAGRTPGSLRQLRHDEVLARVAADGDLLRDLLPGPAGHPG